MRVDGIYSMREHKSKVYADIVYEWEEDLAEALNVPILHWGKSHELACRLIKFRLSTIIKRLLFGRKKRYLRFVMNAMEDTPLFNHRTCIPIIIDFFVSDNYIDKFIDIYRNCEYVFISSRQAYDKLLSYNLPFKIVHFPLFISLREYGDITHDKIYNLTVFGDQINDTLFMKWIRMYTESHKGFTYVYKIKDGNTYVDSNGNFIANIDCRSSYFALMRTSRAVVYSTPGIRGRKDANGYDQVTPKFLEYISSYCHVIMRYPINSDTEYFDLRRFGLSVSSYDDFAYSLDKALASSVSIDEYDSYLTEHSITHTLNILESL